ncbi:MAG: hypothetical protein IPM96_06115 [Ignavibacteria bacterium]|nr:hypothetical protein [Ignavibacteria bacterium]
MKRLTEIMFSGLSVEDGLSNSSVSSVLQDRQGFMWFGTQDGLNRYDGYDFKIYRNDNQNESSLSNNFVNILYEDNAGALWIGTDGGLNVYDRDMDNFRKTEISDQLKISGPVIIKTIFEDNDEKLWIGTYGSGLICLDRDRNFIGCFKHDRDDESSISGDRISSVIQDSHGTIFIGTWGKGLNMLVRGGTEFRRYMNKADDDRSLSENKVDSLYCDRQGDLWVGTTNGLNKFVNGENCFNRFSHDSADEFSLSNRLVSKMCEDKKGNLWIGTKEGGINIYDRDKNRFYHLKNDKDNPYSLGNNSVLDIYCDRSGIMWAGTFGSGLRIYKNQSKKFYHFFEKKYDRNSLSSNKISCFAEDKKGNLLVGTTDKGFNIFNSTENIFKRISLKKSNEDDSPENVIDCIAECKNGFFWIGTSGSGLVKYDPVKDEFCSYSFKRSDDLTKNYLYIFSVYADDDGIIWYGTAGKGIYRFDPVSEKAVQYSLNPEDINDVRDKRIRKIAPGFKNELLLGSSTGGLLIFDKVKKNFRQFKNDPKDPGSISSNFTTDFLKDSKGNLWIGTYDSGLNILPRGSKNFIKISTKDGLPNNTINGILEDDQGNIWISSNKGISKIDPANNRIKNYDVRDGLQSNEFNAWACIKMKNGDLVFGGINGFNIFRADEINDNTYVPEIIITDFKIFNKEVKPGIEGSPLSKSVSVTDELNLTYKESVFSFEFSALDFNIPGKNAYAYRMKGFDSGWINSGNRRFATYTNLDAGEYEFNVIGSNNDGIWNTIGDSIKINITPPFWKKKWFKSLSALSVIAASGSVYQSKINRLRKDRKAQEEFTKKLLETQENERKRIAGELHDSIGQDLLISKNKLQISLNNPDDSEIVFKNINEVSDVITDALKNVREISYSLHPYQIERLGLSKAIGSIIERLKGTAEIKFTCSIDNIDKILLPESEISIYRIIQECMNNILRHSEASEVILNISRGENFISILIGDDGIGFDENKLKSEKGKHGFGIQGILERIRLIKGEMNIESVPGEGTTLNFKVPF